MYVLEREYRVFRDYVIIQNRLFLFVYKFSNQCACRILIIVIKYTRSATMIPVAQTQIYKYFLFITPMR